MNEPKPANLPCQTLGDVLGLVEHHPDLTPARRRDFASAINIVSRRMLQRGPGQLPADARVLQVHLSKLHPSAFNMTPRRFANVRADLRAALRLANAPGLPRGPKGPRLSSAWQALRDGCPQDAFRWRTSALMTHCSDKGIEPQDLSQAVFDSFIMELATSSLNKNPSVVERQTASAWNTCLDSVAGWPPVRLSITKSTRYWTLPWSAFPQTLQQEVEAYLASCSNDDLFNLDDLRPQLRPKTISFRRVQLQTAASALVLSGLPASELRSLADLVALDRIERVVRHLLERYGGKTPHLSNIALTLKTVGQEVGQLGDVQLVRLTQICRRLKVRHDGLAPRNATRLRPFEDPACIDQLLLLPEKLMKSAGNAERPTRAQALLAEAAVALEIELMTLLRIGNLASLRLGETIILQRRGLQDAAFIALAAAEVKNGQRIELELPPTSAKLIRRYVERFLPVLGAPGNDHLFPGQCDGHKKPAILGDRLTHVIREEVGHYVHPHLLRHLGGLIYLKDHPGDYETVRRMLGHKSLTTTLKYYVNLETRLAALHFDRNVLNRRQAARVRLTGRR